MLKSKDRRAILKRKKLAQVSILTKGKTVSGAILNSAKKKQFSQSPISKRVNRRILSCEFLKAKTDVPFTKERNQLKSPFSQRKNQFQAPFSIAQNKKQFSQSPTSKRRNRRSFSAVNYQKQRPACHSQKKEISSSLHSQKKNQFQAPFSIAPKQTVQSAAYLKKGKSAVILSCQFSKAKTGVSRPACHSQQKEVSSSLQQKQNQFQAPFSIAQEKKQFSQSPISKRRNRRSFSAVNYQKQRPACHSQKKKISSASILTKAKSVSGAILNSKKKNSSVSRLSQKGENRRSFSVVNSQEQKNESTNTLSPPP